MIPENRIPTHPGVILSQEFLVPLGISHDLRQLLLNLGFEWPNAMSGNENTRA